MQNVGLNPTVNLWSILEPQSEAAMPFMWPCIKQNVGYRIEVRVSPEGPRDRFEGPEDWRIFDLFLKFWSDIYFNEYIMHYVVQK